MQAVPSLNLVYTDEEGYVTAEEAKEKELSALKLSGTKFRKMLRGGEDGSPPLCRPGAMRDTWKSLRYTVLNSSSAFTLWLLLAASRISVNCAVAACREHQR